ncbi:DUF5801 repeats-in-toxin domain-containing protein (plasmid) [Ensifer adhaerens]|uniref:beta strand repeat-containing protein n=1 Tax=Ensifer adhaerens TaxID=106592 RepID=UPI0023A949A1|nr:DUF5801 repeats-in-toxin domain-containing protein [Ensifer adhaerens]WDZ81894.1 DUF5801 repeats-in-toxin domain-containing protein [Ensifer adhaerens]
MALDILTQDIIVDESTGLTDNDIDSSSNTNATLVYLLSLDDPGGLISPEVAYQANFVQASASAGETINSIILTQSASGTPFSTTVGVNSGILTADGNYVWLFQDPTHPNVVIGVIGTADPAAAPAADGSLAFAFGLDPTSSTKADLYLVQYVALSHPDPDQIDERIDLTDKVFASVSGTTVLSFLGQNAAPGNHDFYVINSSTDASKQLLVTGFLNGANATANVSTQGFGVDNQSINPTETVQVDFVTGSNIAAGSGSQIQYGSHLNNVTQAGFTINQITPSNPNLRVDITIKAFDNTGNEQGSNFFDGTATNPVDIVSIKLTGVSGFATTITADGTYATGSGNVIISGLTGTGNAVTIRGLDNVTTVDITTATQMDRLTVTGVDANEGCDITEFHFTSQTSNAYTEQVGSFINFDDSGPLLSITAAPVVAAAAVDEASGAGGQSQATITAPTFDASAVDGKTTSVDYALTLTGPTATGLQTTDGNHAITLVADSATSISGKYDSDGNGSLDATAFTVTLSGTTVTLTSLVALEHDNSQGAGEDNTLDLNGLIKVVATVTTTDGDQDAIVKQSTSAALSLTFNDTDPTLSITAAPVVAAAAVDEASGAGGQNQATITAPTFDASAVDGKTTSVDYALTLTGPTATGLQTTDGNHAITLVADSATSISGKYDSDGNGSLDATAFTVTLSGTTVTLTSLVALEHDNSQGAGEDNTLDLNGLIKVVATVTTTDGDQDAIVKQSTSAALSLTFNDTDPTLSITAAPVVAAAAVDEASGAGGQNQATITAPTFDASAVDGKTTSVDYALTLTGPTATGLQTTDGNHAITLVADSATSISGKYDSDGNGSLDATAFTVTLSGTTVTLTSLVALEHDNSQGAGEDNTLDLNGLIKVVATVTTTDGDQDAIVKQSTSAALSLTFNDTDPTLSITAAPVVAAAAVDEASGAGGQNQATITAPTFDASAVDGKTTSVDYALTLTGPTATGLQTTDGNHAITLVADSATSISGKYDSDGNGSLDATAFTVTLSGTTVTLTSLVALEHDNSQGAGEDNTLDLNGLIKVVATVTTTDGDQDAIVKQSTSAALSLTFNDTDPTLSITAAPVVAAAAVDEASGAGGQNQATITAPTFDASAVDGKTTSVDYALTLTGPTATGLQTTDGNHAITLVADSATSISGKYDSDGNGSLDATAFTVTLSGTTVTLTSLVALEHDNSQGAGEDNTLDLNGLIKVVATVTTTDGDQDAIVKQSTSAALSLTFNDTDPTLSITAAPVVAAAAVDEASGAGGQNQATITAPTFDASAVDGKTTSVDYALTLTGPTATGLQTTDGNHAITLVADSATSISGKYDSDGNGSLDATAFTVTLSGTTVTLTSLVALEHDNSQGAGEDNTLDLNGLIKVVATVTTTDGDQDAIVKQSTSAALSLTFNDTDPTITKPFDADPGTAGIQTPEHLNNVAQATASGVFGYDMTDKHTAAEYTAGISDFVDANGALGGIQIGLTGTVDNAQNPNITNAVATLTGETDTSATFNFSFHYDKDPITAGVQDSTAAGTLVFDKVADTYTFTLTDIIDGFSFDVLHTAELVSKEPTSNSGHPNIVTERLTPNNDPDPLFVQFTANSTTSQVGFSFNTTGADTNSSDKAFDNGDFVANNHPDWVSATQTTNGVAGDTIQLGEVLTLRFFDHNVGIATEATDPDQTASGVVLKFDGIGTSEDLMMILNLIDYGADGKVGGTGLNADTETTRAIRVDNIDIIKGNANVPFPYSTEFSLDNNDGLVIIESNDYNLDAGKKWQIQGVQIMQSGNGLTGSAINFNGVTGANGFSSGTQTWDNNLNSKGQPIGDNDVLKIVDIGFVQNTSGTIPANLDFAFQVADADGDTTATQHILVNVDVT